MRGSINFMSSPFAAYNTPDSILELLLTCELTDLWKDLRPIAWQEKKADHVANVIKRIRTILMHAIENLYDRELSGDHSLDPAIASDARMDDERRIGGNLRRGLANVTPQDLLTAEKDADFMKMRYQVRLGGKGFVKLAACRTMVRYGASFMYNNDDYMLRDPNTYAALPSPAMIELLNTKGINLEAEQKENRAERKQEFIGCVIRRIYASTMDDQYLNPIRKDVIGVIEANSDVQFKSTDFKSLNFNLQQAALRIDIYEKTPELLKARKLPGNWKVAYPNRDQDKYVSWRVHPARFKQLVPRIQQTLNPEVPDDAWDIPFLVNKYFHFVSDQLKLHDHEIDRTQVKTHEALADHLRSHLVTTFFKHRKVVDLLEMLAADSAGNLRISWDAAFCDGSGLYHLPEAEIFTKAALEHLKRLMLMKLDAIQYQASTQQSTKLAQI